MEYINTIEKYENIITEFNNNNELKDCMNNIINENNATYKQFEIKYNEIINKKNNEIKSLYKEVNNLKNYLSEINNKYTSLEHKFDNELDKTIIIINRIKSNLN